MVSFFLFIFFYQGTRGYSCSRTQAVGTLCTPLEHLPFRPKLDRCPSRCPVSRKVVTSLGSRFGVPRCFSLLPAKAGQSQITWMGVYSSPSHFLHVSVSALPSVCRCLVRLQCHVSSPTASLMSPLLILSSWSVIFLSGPLMSAFVCLRLPSSLLCRLSIHSATSVFTWQPATPAAGSDPWSGVPDPLLANSSAVSLPAMPSCPGTHINITLLRSASFCNASLHSLTRWELVFRRSNAFIVREPATVFGQLFLPGW